MPGLSGTLRAALQSSVAGTRLPGDLRKDADKIRAEAALDDAVHVAGSSIDSEYANAGVNDPKVLVTTSHDPSSKLSQFLKEVKLLIQ